MTALARVLRSRFDVVLLHLPRTLDPGVRAALEAADEVLVVATLDVMAFREARRVLATLGGLGLDGRCSLVINRASRSEVVPESGCSASGRWP
ncbi:MAG: hypothetical protein ACRDI0_08815 [Actinomycetota bacterium]